MIVDVFVALGTLVLAAAAFLEISEGNRSRPLQDFDRDVERVGRLDGGDFLLAMRNLARRWREEPRLGAEVRRMELSYERRADRFREQMARLRPALVELAELMVREHPEVRDGGPLVGSQEVSGPDSSRSMQTFAELAEGAGALGWWPYGSAYNSPPGRQAETEEPSPESWMLVEILRYREEALHGQEVRGGRAMDPRFREGFRGLRRRHDEIVGAFVHWKSTGPEGAVHEVMLTAQGLEYPDARHEYDPELARLAEDLARRGFYRSMTSPVGEVAMDEVLEKMLHEQIVIHRRLVERASEGLRPALERGPLHRIGTGTLARRLVDHGSRNVDRNVRGDGTRDGRRERG